MDDVPLGVLFGALIFLIILSGFFSAAEIGLMTLNRYRLQHRAESGQRAARLAVRMLERPDRLLGVILLGNNFANISASAVATIIGMELFGDPGIAIATGLLTFVILVFAEVAPKTLAALYPERIGLFAVYILQPLLTLFYPVVWLVNAIANRFLRLFGVRLQRHKDQLSVEEFKAVVNEAGTLIPKGHQAMLLAILDLEKITVDDVMVPRGEIEGVDLEADWHDIENILANSRYTRLPVYRGTLDNMVGMVHLRKVLHLQHSGKFDKERLMEIVIEPYFIPAGTPLNTQLINFKNVKRRIGLVVDEYGDLLGLVTLEEILEQIVGEFTSQTPGASEEIRPQADGSFLVNGGVGLRELNRRLGWEFPTNGPKTLNGLIIEYLEDIPEPGTSLLLNGYQVDVVRTRGTRVQLAQIRERAAAPATRLPRP